MFANTCHFAFYCLIVLTIGSQAGCGQPAELPAQDNAFLSYLQAAQSFARALDQIRTTADFERQRAGLETAHAEFDRLATIVRKMPAQQRQRLAADYTGMVRATEATVQKLDNWPAGKGRNLGPDWQRYRLAVATCAQR